MTASPVPVRCPQCNRTLATTSTGATGYCHGWAVTVERQVALAFAAGRLLPPNTPAR